LSFGFPPVLALVDARENGKRPFFYRNVGPPSSRHLHTACLNLRLIIPSSRRTYDRRHFVSPQHLLEQVVSKRPSAWRMFAQIRSYFFSMTSLLRTVQAWVVRSRASSLPTPGGTCAVLGPFGGGRPRLMANRGAAVRPSLAGAGGGVAGALAPAAMKNTAGLGGRASFFSPLGRDKRVDVLSRNFIQDFAPRFLSSTVQVHPLSPGPSSTKPWVVSTRKRTARLP